MESLFSADGIRGMIDRYPLRESDSVRLGHAIAFWLYEKFSQPQMLIGCDTRESSQRIKIALSNGLTEAGVAVVDTGIVPTAAISYLIASKGLFHGGIMVSASHNFVYENGIKLFDSMGMKVTDEEESYLTKLFQGEQSLRHSHYPARCKEIPELARHYAEELAEEWMDLPWKKSKILIDCANGAASSVVESVMNAIGCEYILINSVPDGTNINLKSGSEVTRLEPARLQAEIRRYDAEFGVALDGDADRAVFVDRQGQFYDGDLLLSIFAINLSRKNILAKNTVLTTQMHNRGLEEQLARYKIEVKQVRNGDKYITRELVQEGYVLGGEPIGHIIQHDRPFRLTGDGLRTLLKVMEVMAEQYPASLPDLLMGFQKWPQVTVSVHLGRRVRSVEFELPELENIKQSIQTAIGDLSKFEARPASTEPVFRVMMEARSTSVKVLAGFASVLGQHVQKALGCTGLDIIVLDNVRGGQILPSAFSSDQAKALRIIRPAIQ